MKRLLLLVLLFLVPGVLLAQTGPSVTLTWTDNSDNEDGFRLERKIGTGAWTPIGTVGVNVVTFKDVGPFTIGSLHTYRVLAFNAWGDSLPSNEASLSVRTPGASGNLQLKVEK